MAQSISTRSLAAIVQRWLILLVSAWALTVRASSGDDPGVGGLVPTDLSTNATAAPFKVQKLLHDSTILEKNSSNIVGVLPSGAGASNEATSSNDDDGDDRSNAGLTAPPNTDVVATTPTAVTPLLAEKEDSTSKSKELTSGNTAEIVANVTTPTVHLSFLQAIFQAKLARSEAAANAQLESDQMATKDYKGVFVLSATAVKSATTPSAGAAASKSFEKEEDLGVDGLKESTTSAPSFTQPTIAANGVNGITAAPVRRDARPITHPLWRNARGKGSHDDDKEQSNSNPLRVRVHFFLQILDTYFYALSLWKCVQYVTLFSSNPIRCRCTQPLSCGLHHQLGTDLRRASMLTTLLFLRKYSKAFVW